MAPFCLYGTERLYGSHHRHMGRPSVANGIDPARFDPSAPPISLNTSRRFRFLHVGGTIGRKGPDILLELGAVKEAEQAFEAAQAWRARRGPTVAYAAPSANTDATRTS